MAIAVVVVEELLDLLVVALKAHFRWAHRLT
jgi:hypothetical protein